MEPTSPNIPNLNPQEQIPQETNSSEAVQAAEQSSLGGVTPEMPAAPQELGPANKEVGNQNAGMSLPPVVIQPINDNSSVATDDSKTTNPQADDNNDDNPAVADDVDVVEKEWVDRARKIVSQTKDNPYLQEQEVEKLQIDYLKKRYGKEIKPGDIAT